MIKRSVTITGLDIGSAKIAAVVSRIEKNGELSVVAHAAGDSAGVSRGMLVDLNAATDAVAKVLAKVSAQTSKKLGEIYVNISGEDVKGARSVGMIPISLRGREIAKPDIDKSIGVASTIHLPFDREIIHKIVHSFSIDDQPWIRKPLGLYASRLGCEVYVVTANINHIQSIHKCVNDAGYDVREVVFTGIANGMSSLDKEQKESGAVIIDMGSTLTEISVFFGGVLDNFEIVSIGGDDMRGDFRVNSDFASLVSRVNSRIQNLLKISPKATAVVLTGGFAITDGMIECMEKGLSLPVKMGSIKGIQGDISGLDSIRLSAAAGLARYASEKKRLECSGVSNKLSAKVAEIFNNYF